MSTDFDKIISVVSDLVSKKSGIILGPKQRPMIENRLKSRMIKLGLSQVDDYLNHLSQNQTQESEALLSLLTTHHTFFFREFSHFEFLRDKGLLQLVESLRETGEKKIKIWSAACSRGQEVYSLAMFLKEHLKTIAPDFDYEIWGTDIDPESVEIAKKGSYSKEELKSVPQIYMNSLWSEDSLHPENLKASHDLKRNLHFSAENLFDLNQFLIGKKFHIIFCRNVFIYFEKDQIKTITNQFLNSMFPVSYLFVGVSESITSFGLPIDSWGGSIYSLLGLKEKINKKIKGNTSFKEKSEIVVERDPKKTPYKILVVDDSKTIHALMKKILVKTDGFEIINIANNGKEALEYLEKNANQVEAITLDLHMPEIDGLGFLKQYKNKNIPVLVVSAIDRDDSEGPGQMALKMGAFDYVEKPTVENLEQTGNEIRSKLNTGLSLLRVKSNTPIKKQQLKLSLNQESSLKRHETIFKNNLGQIDIKTMNKKPLSSKNLSNKSQIKQILNVKATQPAVISSYSSILKKQEIKEIPKNPILKKEIHRENLIKKTTNLISSGNKQSVKSISSPFKRAEDKNFNKTQKNLMLKSNPISSQNKLNSHLKSKLTKELSFSKFLNVKSDKSDKSEKKIINNPLGSLKKSTSNSLKSITEIKNQKNLILKKEKEKVLIVDDSMSVRNLLKKIISRDPRLEVVGETENPLEVENLIKTLKPTLMTLDIHMPHMDGVTLLKKVFPLYKIPTVMISSMSIEEGPQVLEALEIGAVDYIQKPTFSEMTHLGDQICDRLVTAASAKVKKNQKFLKKAHNKIKDAKETLVLIGSSTGGTEALRMLFETLPNEIPPLLVVQHIPPVFSKALADRLNGLFSFEVKEAEDGDLILPNRVLIAPGGQQMGIKEINNELRIKLSDEAPVNRHKPSVDFLFRSALPFVNKRHMVGIILTGMGGDGAQELKKLKTAGVRTIGQDEESCVVYGMPKVAYELGAVEVQLPISQIGQKMMDWLENFNKNAA